MKIAYRKLKQYQWVLREGHFFDETPKGAYTRSLINMQKGPLSRRQQKRRASEIGSAIPQCVDDEAHQRALCLSAELAQLKLQLEQSDSNSWAFGQLIHFYQVG